jgi:hypothetical protein
MRFYCHRLPHAINISPYNTLAVYERVLRLLTRPSNRLRATSAAQRNLKTDEHRLQTETDFSSYRQSRPRETPGQVAGWCVRGRQIAQRLPCFVI